MVYYYNLSIYDVQYHCLGDAFGVLEYCSAVWCLAVDSYLTLQDYVVSGGRFLTGDVFEFDIALH